MSPFPRGAGPPALDWWLAPEVQQVEGNEVEGMVPGEGITYRGAVKFQSSLRSVMLPVIHLAWELSWCCLLHTWLGGQQAKFPPKPGLWLCFYFCNRSRRYFRSQTKNPRNRLLLEPSRVKLFVWGANQKPFIWVKIENWKNILLHVTVLRPFSKTENGSLKAKCWIALRNWWNKMVWHLWNKKKRTFPHLGEK